MEAEKMWYMTELHEMINLDNIVSLRVIEQIKKDKPKEYWVVGLIATGIHHVDVAQCKTPEEGKAFLQRLCDAIAGEYLMGGADPEAVTVLAPV